MNAKPATSRQIQYIADLAAKLDEAPPAVTTAAEASEAIDILKWRQPPAPLLRDGRPRYEQRIHRGFGLLAENNRRQPVVRMYALTQAAADDYRAVTGERVGYGADSGYIADVEGTLDDVVAQIDAALGA